MPRADWNVLKKYSFRSPRTACSQSTIQSTLSRRSACWRDISARDSRNGIYGISDWQEIPYSALMFAARMTLAHFSIDSPTKLVNSVCEVLNTK
jgi:hypothetical protein